MSTHKTREEAQAAFQKEKEKGVSGIACPLRGTPCGSSCVLCDEPVVYKKSYGDDYEMVPYTCKLAMALDNLTFAALS